MLSKPKRRESPVELWEDLSHELWQVQHGLGEPRLMTLDELDAAFKNDEINARTLVRKAGTTQWRTLGDIAGLPPPSAMTLESESLMPVTSEIEVPAAKKPSKPPPLPRKSKDDIKVEPPRSEAPKAVPRRSDDDIRISQSDAIRLRQSRTTIDVTSEEIELKSSDIDVVKLELDRKREVPTVKQPAAMLRDVTFTREEMRAARPRSMAGKLIAVAAVALVGGGVFAGVSAWLTGTFGSSAATHAMQAPAPPADKDAPPAAAAPITKTEGSVLVLAPNAPEDAKPEASAEAKPEPAPKAALAKPAAAPAKAPLAAAPKKPGARHAHAPGKAVPGKAKAVPGKAKAAPGKAKAAPGKASAHATLPALKGDAKKSGGAKAPATKKAKGR